MKKVVTRLLIAQLVAMAIISNQFSYAQQRSPSTPEQRKRAAEMATSLENDPLSKEAKQYRRDLLVWLAEVPDITVNLCTNVLGDSKRIKGDYSSELMGQLAYSQAKFIIENPDKANDDYSVYLAGVEGVLRAYNAIKKAKPKVKIDLFEELLQKQEKGLLGEHVKSGMAGCKKGG